MKRRFVELPAFRKAWKDIGLTTEGKGKSGGARIIYVDIVVDEAIFFLYAYPKSVKDNLSKEEISNIRKAIAILKE